MFDRIWQITIFTQIDEQRKYLGGDGEHSVLVKGLDFALLEQNKAKAAGVSTVEDDEALEQAFLGVDGGTSIDVVESVSDSKKSRQDIVRELKEKRGQVEKKAADTGIEEAKKYGKFRPIGFKPVGGDPEGKKRKKEREGGEKKKKKRKVDETEDKLVEVSGSTQPTAPQLPATVPGKKTQSEPEPESLDPDFDIFAGVEEYTGDIEDDSEGEDKQLDAEGSKEPQQDANQTREGWFNEPKSPTLPPKEPTPPPAEETKVEEAEEEPAPVRLAPLASSMSVKDILAVDEAVAREEKRKARKEKKKKKGELDAGAKANRDLQKCIIFFLMLQVFGG